jgi:hypothetical protein
VDKVGYMTKLELIDRMEAAAADLFRHAKVIDDATTVEPEAILGGAMPRIVPPMPQTLREEVMKLAHLLEGNGIDTRDLHEVDGRAASEKRVRAAARMLNDIAERMRSDTL